VSRSAASDPASPRLFRAESVTQAVGVYLPTMLVYRGLGMLRVILLTWLLPKSQFGLFQVALLAINVLAPLCGLGVQEGLARYVPQYETRGTLRSYLARVLPAAVLVPAMLAICICLAARPVGTFLFATVPEAAAEAGPHVGLTCIVAATTWVAVLYFVLLSILKGLRMFRAVSLMELLANIGYTLLAICVALAGWPTADAVLLVYLATMLGPIALLTRPLRQTITDHPQAEAIVGEVAPPHPVWQLVRFSLWAALASVMWQAMQYYPTWYLQKTQGPQVTAVFGGVRSLTQMVLVAAVAVVTVVGTSVTKTWESAGPAEADRKLGLAFKVTSLVLLVGCVALSLGAPLLIRLLPRTYALGVEIVPLSVLFFLLCANLSFLSVHFTLIERTRYLFWPWTVGVLTNVVLGMWLVRPGLPVHEALRAAAVSGVWSALAALLLCLVLMRVERRPADLGIYVVLAGGTVLTLPVQLAGVVTAVLVLAVLGTPLVFGAADKGELWGYLRRACARVRWGARR
jgi:O-antigen/teichoic acid export membrane protein